MNIAIIDDEKTAKEYICRLIERQEPDCYLEAYATGEELNEKVILQNQVSSLQQHMEEMERIYSEIRGIKHDMKKHYCRYTTAFCRRKSGTARIFV